jgi:hypothetical protein
MPQAHPARPNDSRTLSQKHPGGGKPQDDTPPPTSPDGAQKMAREQKERVGPDPVLDSADLDRREPRSRSAMPSGTQGSRTGALPGARQAPEGQRP